jgi:hypothetical protein
MESHDCMKKPIMVTLTQCLADAEKLQQKMNVEQEDGFKSG